MLRANAKKLCRPGDRSSSTLTTETYAPPAPRMAPTGAAPFRFSGRANAQWVLQDLSTGSGRQALRCMSLFPE